MHANMRDRFSDEFCQFLGGQKHNGNQDNWPILLLPIYEGLAKIILEKQLLKT